MFRCCNPECRQQEDGFRMTGQNIDVRFIEKDKFKLFKGGQEFAPGLFDTPSVVQATFGKYKMLCKKCLHKAKVKDYMYAYENPMAVFDTDNLCVCGGEIWQDMETVKNNDVPENAEWEGSQRKVSVSIRSVTRCERCNKEFS